MYCTPIKLDKVRNLRFTINSVCLFDEMFKNSFTQASAGLISMQLSDGSSDNDYIEVLKKFNFSDLRNMIWAGLIHEDRTLTPEKVGDIMQECIDQNNSIIDLLPKLAEAWLNFMMGGQGQSMLKEVKEKIEPPENKPEMTE